MPTDGLSSSCRWFISADSNSDSSTTSFALSPRNSNTKVILRSLSSSAVLLLGWLIPEVHPCRDSIRYAWNNCFQSVCKSRWASCGKSHACLQTTREWPVWTWLYRQKAIHLYHLIREYKLLSWWDWLINDGHALYQSVMLFFVCQYSAAETTHSFLMNHSVAWILRFFLCLVTKRLCLKSKSKMISQLSTINFWISAGLSLKFHCLLQSQKPCCNKLCHLPSSLHKSICLSHSSICLVRKS